MLLDTIRFGAHKSPRPHDFELEKTRRRALHMLARCLNLHNTVAVVGAGCSIPRGYASWTKFALNLLSYTVEHLEKYPEMSDTQNHLKNTKDFLERRIQAKGQRVDSGNLMYFVGVCKSAILEAGKFSGGVEREEDPLEEFFKENFGSGTPIDKLNPYEYLLRLPIRRYVTTNYDHEIEEAIGEGKYEQLTQKDCHAEALTRFALADSISDGKMAVFHCHGHYAEPDSIIAGEADYQRWYLGRRESVGSAFRHTTELLFESNPLLFVGYGLSDEDLLRPLRILSTIEPERKPSRPIFAIMPRKSEGDDYRLQRYYERYGLHVISYDPDQRGDNGDSARHNRAFCGVIDEIYQHWQDSLDEWNLKPPPRRVTAIRDTKNGLSPCNWLLSAGINVPLGADLGEIEQLRSFLRRQETPSLIGLVGASGCGKSRRVRHLMVELRERDLGRFPDGYFYWNAHYINEGVTGIDQLLDFLDPEGLSVGARDERLAALLETKKCLVIIDGGERLLRPTSRPMVGTPISAYVRRLLEIFAAPQNEATIIFVGRIWPEAYQCTVEACEPALDCKLRLVRASRVRQYDLVKFVRELKFEKLQEILEIRQEEFSDHLSALCSLLDGDNYCLLLALEWVQNRILDREVATDHAGLVFNEIKRYLTKERLGNRNRRIFEITLRDLDDLCHGSATHFLSEMAYSLNAMSRATLEIILRRVPKCTVKSHETLSFEELLLELERRHMIVPMPRIHETDKPTTYAVHSKIREFIQGGGGGKLNGRLPALSLAGVSSGGVGVDPGANGDRVRSLIISLVDEGDRALGKGRRNLACDFCRDAYSIFRGQLEANTAPRWCDFASYSEIGIHLARLARRIGGDDAWDHRDSTDRAKLENWTGALFLGEMVWLYNDVGLALFGEGLVADAYAVWEQAFEISRVMEDEVEGGSYQIQVLLNLTYAFLELGRVVSAREYLTIAEQMNRSLRDEALGARIEGIYGLIQHLNGNLREALNHYKNALDGLNGSDDFRARSFFHKHRADLYGSLKLDREAESDIRAARIFAQEGNYPDLSVEVQMSRGRFEVRKGNWPEARLHYDAALRAAQRIHSRRLEAAVLCNLARLSLEQRDSGGARHHALGSLKIANELRLGLRLSHSLVILGLAVVDAGQQQLGVAYLKHAKKLASQQQYWFRVREAELKLQELGEE